MLTRLVVIFALCTFGTDTANCLAQNSSVPPNGSNSETLQADSESRIRQASTEEIERAVQNENYQPVPKSLFLKSIESANRGLEASGGNDIINANYEATLNAGGQLNGKLKLTFSTVKKTVRLLGVTNLQDLSFQSQSQQLTLGKTKDQIAVLLAPADIQSVDGYWMSEGQQQSESVTFDLLLPQAVISRFTLNTPPGVVVTSPNSLVLEADNQADTADKARTWTLYPSRSGRLTINCSNRRETIASVDRMMGAQANYNIQKGGCEARWNLNLPSLPSRSEVQLSFSEAFRPQKVIGFGKTNLPFTWDTEQNSLTLQNSTDLLLSSVVISGQFSSPQSNTCQLPVLNSGTWKGVNSDLRGQLKLSSATLRISFSSDLTVQSSNVLGLMETDVEFTADGSQRLTLEQFSEPASAEFQLLLPSPVLQDEVVTRATNETGQVEVLIRIENRSGIAETLHYNVPRTYRVTAVRELDTQLPLLFRIAPSDANSATEPIQIFFRNPLARASQQVLQLSLQSTANDINLTDARLTNPDYLRLTDVVVLNPSRLSPSLLKEEGISYSSFKNQHPWVPAVEDGLVFDRSQLPKAASSSAEEFVVTSSINHTLSVSDQMIRESIQIRLAAAPFLPSEIIFQTADTGDLKLKPFDQQQGFSLQPRISSRTRNEWILQLPQNEQRSTATVTLECERPATGRHIPMLVSLPSTSIRTADIRILGSGTNWSLNDNTGQAVVDTIGYPNRPLETSLRIQLRNSKDRSAQAHGSATWLLDRSNDAIRAGVLLQLSVFGLSDRVSLDVGRLKAQRIQCFVNQHRTDAEIQNRKLEILLPEDGRDSQIQILLQDVVVEMDSTGRLSIPSIQLEDKSFRGIDTIVTPPTGRTVSTADESSVVRVQDGITEPTDPLWQSSSSDIQHFLTRLSLREGKVESLFLKPTVQQKSHTLVLSQAQSLLATSIILSCTCLILLTAFTPNGPVVWLVTGLGILIAQGTGIAFPTLSPLPEILTAAIAAAGAIIYFKHRYQETHNEPAQSSPAAGKSILTGVGVLLLVTSHAQAALLQVSRPQSPLPQALTQQIESDILIPKSDSPIVFVPPEIVSLVAPSKSTSTAPIFLDSQVDINLLNKTSLSADITFHVAVDSAFDQQIELPIEDVTLIKCELEGSLVLPIKSNLGNPAILIPAIPQPAARLAPNSPVIAAPMQGWVADLKVYKVTYTTRIMARPDFAGVTAGIPLPPAPQTQITVLDQTESVKEAKLLTPKSLSGVRLGSEFNYPLFSNISRVDIQLRFATTALDEEKSPQESEVVAKVIATPSALKIDCEYEVRPVDAKSKSVRIERLSNMNLIRAEAADGSVIVPSASDDTVQIKTSVDRQGLQKFKLAWQMPLTFVQEVPIDTQQLRQLNRIPADRLILTASTSDRFTIASIRTEQGVLEPITENQRPAKLTLRKNEQAFLIPTTVDSVTLRLVRLLETREASISQTAVVERNRIRWNCECELQIPDEPIFRQNLTISSDLKIQSISAKSEDIDRLQSWYRDDDQLVVCLREATRGSLVITIDGILPRQPQQNTPLPVVTLPKPVEILEFSLSLSAVEPESVFVQSLEGTIPNTQFQPESFAVPTGPIRFTVTDEQRPLVIRAEPTKVAQATAVAILSKQAEQTQISLFMAFKAVKSPFNLQFSRPSNVAYATSEVLLLPAEGRVISSDDVQQSIDITAEGSVEGNDLSVVVITGIVPAMTSSILTVPLPIFDAPCEFDSFQVLDGRGQNGTTSVPRWVRNILPALPDATSPGNANLLSTTVSPSRDQLRIQLPSTTSSQENATQENVPAFAITTHHIQGDEQTLKGTFATLAFSPAANAMLQIGLPIEAQLMQMRIDGKPAPFQIDGEGTVSVTLVDRTCFVEMDWLQSVPHNNILRAAQVRLPVTNNVEASVFINQNLPETGWRPRSMLAAPIQLTDLLTEITSGLQIIGTGQATAIANASDSNLSQRNLMSDDPAWIQLRSQSAETAEAYARLLEKLQNLQPELRLNRLDSPTPVIEIRKQFPASSLIIILAAVGMLIAGLTTRDSSKSTSTVASAIPVKTDTEGSTEIHQPYRR